MDDVDRIMAFFRLVARRVPRYAGVLRGFQGNWDRAPDKLAFWTEARERGFRRIIERFDRDWQFARSLFQAYGHIFPTAKALWQQMETLAKMMSQLCRNHEWAIDMMNVWRVRTEINQAVQAKGQAVQ